MSENQTSIHYIALPERTPLAVLTIDIKGVITDVSVIDAAWRGGRRAEVIGKKINTFIHHDMTSGLIKDCKQTVQAGKTWYGAVKCYGRDGAGHWNDIFVLPHMREESFYAAQVVLFTCAEPLNQRAEYPPGLMNHSTCSPLTGGADASCQIRYASDMHHIEIQSLAALMLRHQGELQRINQHHHNVIKQADQLLYEQKKEAQGIHHALRRMLDDQHQATCAATRSMQLIMESQQSATQGRSALNSLSRTSRHQLSRLERTRDQLNALSCRDQGISKIIDTLSEVTEETHFMMHMERELDDASGIAVTNREIHHLAATTRTSIGELVKFIQGWRHTARHLVQDVDADIQRTQHSLSLIEDTDIALQTIISVADRLNALALNIDTTMHHQAILRATTSYRAEAIQEGLSSVVGVNKDMLHQVEKMSQQLGELCQLARDFTQAIERARA